MAAVSYQGEISVFGKLNRAFNLMYSFTEEGKLKKPLGDLLIPSYMATKPYLVVKGKIYTVQSSL